MPTREQVFNSRELSGKFRRFADNSRNKMVQAKFRLGMPMLSWDPSKVEWDERQFTERLAPFIGFTDTAPETKVPDDVNKVARMTRIAHSVEIQGHKLFRERENGELTPNAVAYVDDAILEAVNRIERSLELLCSQSILDAVSISPAAVPGSKVTFSHSFGLQTWAYNIDSGGADFATTTTNLVKQVALIVNKYKQNAGMLPGQTIMNSLTEQYFTDNDDLLTLLQNPAAFAAVIKSDARVFSVLNGLNLANLLWSKHVGGYKADGSTWSEFITTDKIVFMPEDAALKSVLAMAEGYGLLPAGLWGSPERASDLIVQSPTPGYSAYAELKVNPIRVVIHFEWIGLPIVTWPKGLLVATVS